MFRNNANDKKNTLLAQKEKLLQEIQCYEKKIDEFSNKSSNVYFGADSSDSDSGFPTYLDIGPSISELKRQDRLLKTCLQATQELTSVTVLESEVQILVNNPDIGSEKPVSEQGVWREVTAECRLDLVPFTILFYVHRPSRCFSALCYRGVRVCPVKAAQAAELAGSVLHSLTTPADVLETVRSYAVAYRSRRGSLARLADRYASALYMQPREEGGFVLRCGSVMQMVWRLENKVSPLAHFQHKMSFELEYMDESFLKIIKQAHRQLSDPSLQTDERTQLLSKIISTCIEAQGQDNMESDTDSRKLEKTTLDDDDDDGGDVEERDKEVMAPPKAIPKRFKPKGKENDDGNRKSVKRNAEQIDVGVKKARTDVDVTDSINASENDAINNVIVDITHKKVTGRLDDNPGNDNVKNNAKTSQVNPSDKKLPKKITKSGQDKESVSDPKKKKNNEEKKSQESKLKSVRNSEGNKNHKENHEKVPNQIIEQSRQSDKVTVNLKNVKNVKNNSDGSKTSRTNQAQTDEKSSGTFQATKITKESTLKKAGNLNVNSKIVVNSKTSKSKKTGTETINNKNTHSDSNTKKIAPETDNKTDNHTEPKNKGIKPNSTNAKVISSNKTANKTDNAKKTGDDNANGKQTLKSETENVKPVNSKKTVTTSGDSMKRRESDLADSDSANNKKVAVTDITHKKVSNDHDIAKKSVNTAKPTKTGVIKSAIAKIVNNDTEKNKKSVNSNNTVKQVENSDPNCNKMNSKINTISSKNDAKLTNVTVNSKNPSKDIKTKMVIKNHRNSSGKATKKMTAKPSLGKESKIPQKKLSPAYAAVLKQNPVRISPRMLSKFKSPSDSNIQSKLFKPVTNIPRLMKKPAPKSK